MVVEERTDDIDSRVSRLEGVVEQINLRLTGLETRMNVQIVLTFGVWATVVGILLVMLMRD